MQRFIFVLLSFVVVSIIGCGGGGSSINPPPHETTGIKGPQSISEGSSTEYRVERAASSTATYQWAVSPAIVGTFSAPNEQTTTFTAGPVAKDTPVTIKVTATPDKGTPEVMSLTVTIKDGIIAGNKPPVASAQADPTSIHPGGSIQFTDKSIDPDSPSDIVKWEWDFSFDSAEGFKAEASTKSPSFTFPKAGDFIVQLRVTDRAGVTDTLDQPIHILVTTGHLAPVAKATCTPNPVKVCETLQLNDDGSYAQDGGSLLKYEWDWNNDGSFDLTGKSVTHNVTKPGTYFIQLRVTDNTGASSILATPLIVVVNNPLPIAVAHVSNIGPTVGENVVFDGLNSYDTDCGYKDIVKYEWDWQNDGIFDDTGEVITRFFDYPGVHTVTLRVTDDEGGTSVTKDPLSVVVQPGHSYYWGGLAHDSAYSIAVDADDNIYITGRFEKKADFDPDISDYFKTTKADSGAYLLKLDKDKKFLWVTTWGDTGFNQGNDVFVSTPGYIYVAGSTTVIKFDQQGNVLWKYDNGKTGEAVAVDDYTGVWVTGHFNGGATEPDAFLANLSYAGSLNWEKTWGGKDSDQANDVGTDTDGNGYVVGHYSGQVDFDPGSGKDIHTAQSGTDAFLSKFDPNGNFLWTRVWGATDAFGLAVASCGQIYVTGYYEGTTNFNPFGNSTCTGAIGSYLSAFDLNGGFMWVNGWTVYTPPPPSNYRDPGYAIATDADGSVYVSGSFQGLVDFDPDPWTSDNRDNGGAYLVKYTDYGAYKGARTWGYHYTDAWDSAWSVAIDSSGNALVAGDFTGKVDFGVNNQEIRGTRGGYDAVLLEIPNDYTW